ncbi:IMP3 [Symbiodinium sp. CCMP2456]|nr:IMP3 [Symbiodinium sp. CCMP2456]
MRKLKFHEQKLLKKVNFYDWKSTDNVRESALLQKYQIENREDFTKYHKLAGLVTKVVAKLRKMKASDEDRIKMTEILLDKLYSLALIQNKQSLEDCVDLHTSRFCRRRLPVVLVKMRLCENLPQAITYIKQGEVRIGPDLATNPALHVTREMEDHITWAEGSKMRRHIKEFSNEVDDFDLLGN